MQEHRYSIGEVAKLTGASVKTIRYYDEIGLLPPAALSDSGYRYYSNREVWRLELILTLRYVGFSVKDIRKVLSGEVEATTAIDWQLEALASQIKHLSSIQTILHRAKTDEKGADSLRHIHDIVEVMSTSNKERKQFILQKMQSSFIPAQLPTAWKEQMLQSLAEQLPTDGKLTVEQAAAWAELEELLDDPAFVQVMQQNMSPLFQNTPSSHPNIDNRTWKQQYMQILHRAEAAVETSASADSSLVQTIVHDLAALYADFAKQPLTTSFLQQFVRFSQISYPEQAKRFWQLLATVNPRLARQQQASHLLLAGIEWMGAHLEDATK